MLRGKARPTTVTVCTVAVAMTWGMGIAVNASIVLSDLNSTLVFNQDGAGKITGADDWVTDGIAPMSLQWFWFRVGPTGPEARLDTLNQTINTQTGDLLNVTFSDSQGAFAVDVTYLLVGGTPGSGLSDVSQQVTIRNTGGTELDFHLFEYNDFNIGSSPSDDIVEFDGYRDAMVSDAGSSSISATVYPAASRREAGAVATTLNKLDDSSADDLNNVGGPLSGIDASFAFQWDVTLGVGQTRTISQDMTASVPEPATLALLMIGSPTLLRRRRRRM